MFLAVKHSKWAWILFPLSWLTTFIHLFTMEYFVGLELIRVILLWMIVFAVNKWPSKQHGVELLQRVHFDLDHHRGIASLSRRRTVAAERPLPPGVNCRARSSAWAPRARWLSLISTASSSPPRWFQPPPQRTAYFSSRRQPGVVLRVS